MRIARDDNVIDRATNKWLVVRNQQIHLTLILAVYHATAGDWPFPVGSQRIINTSETMIEQTPEWCLVYANLGNQEIVRVDRELVPDDLPDEITGNEVCVCGRSFWLSTAKGPEALPDADIVAVKRVNDGKFEHRFVFNRRKWAIRICPFRFQPL
jgi:hypothetical protein